MGLFSFVGDLFGGGSKTTVNTTQAQDINFNPNISTTTNIDTKGLGEGIAQGVSSLGNSIREGIAEQQDIINITIDTVDEEFQKNVLKLVLLIGAGAAYYFFIYKKKGGKSFGSFKIQLPKNKLIA